MVFARAAAWALPIVAPLDAARSAWLRLLARRGLARALVTQPELRVALGGLFAIAVALLGTLLFPLWLLALGPLLLGVPHLLADVRYLIVRPGHQKRRALAVLVGVPLAAAGLGAGMAAGLVAVLMAVLCARGPAWRKAAGVTLVAGLLYLGRRHTFYMQELVLAHAHNLIAVLLWLLWRPRVRLLHLLPLALFLGSLSALMSGALQPALAALSWRGPEDLGLDGHLYALAPDLPETWGLRLVLCFCFAQGVHYSMWLRLIPEEDRERPTPRTFRASLHALHADLGTWLLLLALFVSVGLVAWALRDLVEARNGYFRLATFHGYLELCALALWAVEGTFSASGQRARLGAWPRNGLT